MSSIKSVVKVMNFHSLLRVDKARQVAKKYGAMENVLTYMIDNIMNNRNISIDNKVFKIKDDLPKLRVYIGSDMGFCNNLNSLVSNEFLKEAEDETVERIVIGRKVRHPEKVPIKLFLTREEYDEDNSKVMDILENAVTKKQYSNVQIIYNHYYNSSKVGLVRKQIFPVEKNMFEEQNAEDEENVRVNTYKEDFTFEGEAEDILVKLIGLYARYSMEIAAAGSYAAENINRQNVTTESMKRIDERDEARAMATRKAEKDKQFAKVLDNFTKMKTY